MVESSTPSSRHGAVLVVQPNRNLTWRKTKLVFLFLSACIVAVSSYFASLGAWLVLPFAGIEILVIGLGLYLQCCHAHQQQVIEIDDRTVSVSHGRRHLVSFPTSWTKVVQSQDPKGWYPGRLCIGAHGRYIELGKYLIESERLALANNLRSALQGV